MPEMFSGHPAPLPNAVVELSPATSHQPPATIVPLHPKAGFLLVGSEVFAYRYQAAADQLVITNRDGGLLFPVLSGDDAKWALAEIQKLKV